MESAKLGDLIVQDLVSLCFYFSKRLEFKSYTQNEHGGKENNMYSNRNTGESDGIGGALMVDNFSSCSEEGKGFESSVDSVGNFQTVMGF
jgi:hypothetical protein